MFILIKILKHLYVNHLFKISIPYLLLSVSKNKKFLGG